MRFSIQKGLCLLLCLALLPGVSAPAFADGELEDVTGDETVDVTDDDSGVAPVGDGGNDVLEYETFITPLYASFFKTEALPALPDDAADPAGGAETYCATVGEAAAVVRGHLTARDTTFSVFYAAEDYADCLQEVYDAAVEHTGNPREGDYLRFQIGGWNAAISGTRSDGVYYLRLSYAVLYNTSAEQEAELDAAFAAFMDELSLPRDSAVETVRAVYDSLVPSITYDITHRNRKDRPLMLTAYGALVERLAVCEGIASLVYRIMLACGYDCRMIVSGEHAWNIVRVGSSYYYTDLTLEIRRPEDMETVPTEYAYLLLSQADYTDFLPDSEYRTAAFRAAYPMAGQSYLCVETFKTGDGAFAAPEKDGCVFAGWYYDDAFTAPYTAATGYALPRFADADVLTVKYQLLYPTYAASERTTMRIITTVESLDPALVGFTLAYTLPSTGQAQTLELPTAKVYTRLTGTNGLRDFSYTPAVFSPSSAYFCAFSITVANALYNTPVTVTPFWITADGTTVTGEAKTITVSQSASFVP